ncbi:MAG: TonB family protein [Alphaproteobacteria bacterium]|nr:TonB family protein [Alphaproteobacteria bacterium]MDB5721372.1 TonB family protein [Alphaproteobacteria bacterium]
MTQGGFYQQKRMSPAGITVVVLLHGAALTALMTARSDYATQHKEPPIVVKLIKDPPPPPPNVPPPPHPRTPQQVSVIDTVKPIVPLPQKPVVADIRPLDLPPLPYVRPGNETVLPPLPPPPVFRDPVRSGAEIDSRSPLQPPYPASAQREGAEGSVQVRVSIGADGRVKAVEKVRASRDDFFVATERQALRYWRFKPALLDGKPIESSKLMSVTFRLDEGNG